MGVRIQTNGSNSWAQGRAIAQAVSRRLPGFKSGSGHVGFCDGQKWRWGTFSPRTSVSPANLQSICFSSIIFTITRGWHNRPGVAAVPIASQTRIKKKELLSSRNITLYVPCYKVIELRPVFRARTNSSSRYVSREPCAAACKCQLGIPSKRSVHLFYVQMSICVTPWWNSNWTDS
jgi:hypothetical protein